MKLMTPFFKHQGFTLAELLIALAILGVIATFTIPKILSAQQSDTYKAIAKEDLSMISAALEQYKWTGNLSGSTSLDDLTPYMNFVKLDTSGSSVDDDQLSATEDCLPAAPCLRMHNGSAIHWLSGDTFGGTNTTTAMWFHIDADGVASSNKAVGIFLYYNGRLADEGQIVAGTANSAQSFTADTAKVPPWFSC